MGEWPTISWRTVQDNAHRYILRGGIAITNAIWENEGVYRRQVRLSTRISHISASHRVGNTWIWGTNALNSLNRIDKYKPTMLCRLCLRFDPRKENRQTTDKYVDAHSVRRVKPATASLKNQWRAQKWLRSQIFAEEVRLCQGQVQLRVNIRYSPASSSVEETAMVADRCSWMFEDASQFWRKLWSDPFC